MIGTKTGKMVGLLYCCKYGVYFQLKVTIAVSAEINVVIPYRNIKSPDQ